jgi:hypothetical protein
MQKLITLNIHNMNISRIIFVIILFSNCVVTDNNSLNEAFLQTGIIVHTEILSTKNSIIELGAFGSDSYREIIYRISDSQFDSIEFLIENNYLGEDTFQNELHENEQNYWVKQSKYVSFSKPVNLKSGSYYIKLNTNERLIYLTGVYNE